MKSPIAYYLLLLYITVMLKPLIPVVSDALAHTFNNTIHIGTVHAKYGNNHLAIAVASTASEESNKHQASTRFEESISMHLFAENTITTASVISIGTAFPLYQVKKWSAAYLPMHMPPPRLFL